MEVCERDMEGCVVIQKCVRVIRKCVRVIWKCVLLGISAAVVEL